MRKIFDQIKLVYSEYFQKSVGPSKIGVFTLQLLPQLSILMRSGFEMFHDKDSIFLEEFKLFYEKEKQRCQTLESMIQVQKDNISKMLKEEKIRRKHDEEIFKEQKNLEKQKWEAYYGETQRMYKDFESTTSKSN
jgi:hypothetical protein